MKWEYKYFTVEEVSCKCGCGMLPKIELMEYLERLRMQWGKPIIVASVARCAIHNRREGGAAKSAHVLGLAADVKCHSEDARHLAELAMRIGFKGVGASQKLGSSLESRYLHLDLHRFNLWSY